MYNMHYSKEKSKETPTNFYTVGYFNILCWDDFLERITLKNTNNIHTRKIK